MKNSLQTRIIDQSNYLQFYLVFSTLSLYYLHDWYHPDPLIILLELTHCLKSFGYRNKTQLDSTTTIKVLESLVNQFGKQEGISTKQF